MAASANPSGGHNDTNNGNRNGRGGGVRENANGAAGTANSVVRPGMKVLRHNPGISTYWTPEELSTLEDLLNKYDSEPNLVRYAKIAQVLNEKTVRDIAFRCRYVLEANIKENGKRGKDEHTISRKNKVKKEKITESLPRFSQVANRSDGHPYVQSMMSMDGDDGISYQDIGGAAGQLLEQNAQALDQITANCAAFKIDAFDIIFSFCICMQIHENINLFCQARDNILSILNDFNDIPEIMKHMPPLPVKLNEELANSILPHRSFLKKC
ncbi:hypothetical protein ACJIZ3_012375 [Penstemon smallii]|uniref:Myb-like domain-containing protein n=1 Tax=Penstemon smallii TaxID=265156 RepID=A0ABD3UPQ6_9LAMI